MSKELTFPTPTEKLNESILPTLEPMTVEAALATNIPDLVLSDWEDKIALARDLNAAMVPGMTEFQIKEFVAGDVADRVTPYGVYHQALRELGTRYTNILQARYEWEKNQARLMSLKASKARFTSQLEELPDSAPSYQIMKLEAGLARVDAEIDHLLRSMPLQEVQLRDTVRQLVHYTEVWQEVKDKIDTSISDSDMQKIEWEAKVLLRYYKGKLGYIPTQFENEFLNNALELAMDMREYGFSHAQACEVGGHRSEDWQKVIQEIISRDGLEMVDALLPISNQDELPSMIFQRRQQKQALKQALGQKFGSSGSPVPPHVQGRR